MQEGKALPIARQGLLCRSAEPKKRGETVFRLPSEIMVWTSGPGPLQRLRAAPAGRPSHQKMKEQIRVATTVTASGMIVSSHHTYL